MVLKTHITTIEEIWSMMSDEKMKTDLYVSFQNADV